MNTNTPYFSIITVHAGSGDVNDPLFSSVASLADQEEMTSEQLLQHTGEATNLWNKLSRELALSKRSATYTLRLLEEKGAAFSEALHHGMPRATGEIIGFLQPGEQYLPGALAAVAKEFEAHPEIDFLITGAFLMDATSRKKTTHPAVPLSLEYLWTCHPKIIPSTFFVRSSVAAEIVLKPVRGVMAFPEWLFQFLQAGKKGGVLNTLTTFSQEAAMIKPTSFHHAAPTMMSFLRPWWQWRHHRALSQAARRWTSSTDSSDVLIYQPNSLLQRSPLE